MSTSRINTNVQSLRAYTNLQSSNNELSMRRERLSTGKRINKAEDDSAGYSIAKKLEAKTRGQSQALKNIGDAKGMLAVAEGGLNSSMDILQTMKEKAVQASNDSMGQNERNAIQSQLDELSSEIGETLGGTEFNGTELFNGTETIDNGGTEGDESDDVSGENLVFQVGAEAGKTFEVGIEALSAESFGKASTVAADGTETEAVNDLTSLNVNGNDGEQEDEAAGLARENSIRQIDAAIGKVSEQMSSLGDAQTRLTFKEENLETSRTNYKESQSRIEDADFAKEQMQIAKQQILQQTGTASLAQANASSQSVLSLIG